IRDRNVTGVQTCALPIWEQLQIQVKEILGRFGRDVLLVSHSRDEIYYLCGRTAIMHQGRILKTDGTGEIFADPGTRAGAALTGRSEERRVGRGGRGRGAS